ncbi:MAG: ABC transporter ATP-binding protein, partial [Sphingomonas sp.]
MASVEISGLSKRFGDTTVLEPTDLTIADGEFVVLVGPSGCGKSTLLRIIAGLDLPSAGRVMIGGRDVTDAAPSDRGLAMVFQSYALYPHLTVAENIAFPLKVAKVARREIADRVAEVAAMLDLSDLLDRRPRALSGGQRQRVSIARAVVRDVDHRRPELLMQPRELVPHPRTQIGVEVRQRLVEQQHLGSTHD